MKTLAKKKKFISRLPAPKHVRVSWLPSQGQQDRRVCFETPDETLGEIAQYDKTYDRIALIRELQLAPPGFYTA